MKLTPRPSRRRVRRILRHARRAQETPAVTAPEPVPVCSFCSDPASHIGETCPTVLARQKARPAEVTCPECGHEQGDMGRGVACEACGHGPMPTRGGR